MYAKGAIVFVILFSVFHYNVSTGLLFNALKNTVQSSKCKLHNLGSKIVQHSHHHGDPCAQQEIGYGDYDGNGNSNFGNGNNNFGSQNGYQVTENLNGDRQNGYGNQKDLYENSHDYGKKIGTVSDCIRNLNCPTNKACINFKCLDPCLGTCGVDADCQVSNHKPFCLCRTGYTRDPFRQCIQQSQGNQQQGNIFNGHSYETTSSQNSDNYGTLSSIISYQIVTSTLRNDISKSSANQEIGNVDQQSNSKDHVTVKTVTSTVSYINTQKKDIFNNLNDTNQPIDHFLTETDNKKYQTTEPNVNKTIDKLVDEIFGNKNIENIPDNSIDNQESSGYKLNPKATSEMYPSTPDIDIRFGERSSAMKEKKKNSRVYAEVPKDGGRNIIKVSCPGGTTATKDGECLEEF